MVQKGVTEGEKIEIIGTQKSGKKGTFSSQK
jgi:hypothetical protein